MECNAENPKGTGHVDIWQEPVLVRFGAIDRSDRMSLGAIFDYFQEAAISHAENLDVGRKDMAQTGQVWILSRMSVAVTRRPGYMEKVTVRSWPRGGEKLFAIRDYDIRDKDGIPIVSARSGWLIVDMEKRRPLRPNSVMDQLPKNEGADALSVTLDALPERGSLADSGCLQKIMERKALYTDIDYNGHVNNVRYIQWIEDSLDPQLLENAGKMRMDINYLNETLSGEVIQIMFAEIEGKTYAFEGRKENGQAAFRAELRLS